MGVPKQCPNCQVMVSQEQLRSYSSLLGLRRDSRCSNCGSRLKWAAGPWYLTHVGGLITFASGLGFVASWIKLIGPNYSSALFITLWLGIIAMFCGIGWARLELVD
ncbi:MAG: hypothetical protein JSU95_19245 [Betaproteobacteria bacterium]|nr:MAG: hypothetical protein JSU95_19245 [Betaproteobacteria bacterium]